MNILLATFKERKICVIEGYIFYLSSGKNSAKAGFTNTWVPIRGLEESGIGSFVKPYVPRRSSSNSEIIKLVMGDDFFGYYENKIGAEYEDFPDELLKEQFCRLGNIKTACISLKIGGGFWNYKDFSECSSSTAEIIRAYLETSKYYDLNDLGYNFVNTGKIFKSYKEALDWLIVEQNAIFYGNKFPSSEEILENEKKQKQGFINTRRDNFYNEEFYNEDNEKKQKQGFINTRRGNFYNEGDYNDECLTPTFPGLNEQWYKEQQTRTKAATKIQSIYRGQATRSAMQMEKMRISKGVKAIEKSDAKFYLNKQKGGITVGREHNAKLHPICVYCKGAGFIGQNIKCTCCNGSGYI
ncbi:hypothetical protein EDC55_10469 [Allofrancisella inopinata]|uniref:Uncharacterized protein n=1 Tax=Allofrancisella inopinata TaxID=1085647 RepID=A0AAE6YIQ3_9GAMM|nr:hypothetical protein [Allofrancisella inopinata]QIV96413.1 hypothetical protein E4K63_06060 [Allofrancisella inopinata]TDT73396.1 hypothetical protein EDC55_10469 [Allofrancisella inopinata]